MLPPFEAKLEAELAAQEMMAEIEEEMARAAALKAFQDKLIKQQTKPLQPLQLQHNRDALLEQLKLAALAEAETRSRTCCSRDDGRNRRRRWQEAAAAEMMAEIEKEMHFPSKT